MTLEAVTVGSDDYRFNADCWCDRFGQRILEVAREKASLADIYIPDQND
jgi:hypothetical protein